MVDRKVAVAAVCCAALTLLLFALDIGRAIDWPVAALTVPVWGPLALVGLWIVGTGLLTLVAHAFVAVLGAEDDQ